MHPSTGHCRSHFCRSGRPYLRSYAPGWLDLLPHYLATGSPASLLWSGSPLWTLFRAADRWRTRLITLIAPDGRAGSTILSHSEQILAHRLSAISERCKFFSASWWWNSCRSTRVFEPFRCFSYALSAAHCLGRAMSYFRQRIKLLFYFPLPSLRQRHCPSSRLPLPSSWLSASRQWHYGTLHTTSCSRLESSQPHSALPRSSCWTWVQTWWRLNQFRRRALKMRAACGTPCKCKARQPCRTSGFGSPFWLSCGRVHRHWLFAFALRPPRIQFHRASTDWYHMMRWTGPATATFRRLPAARSSELFVRAGQLALSLFQSHSSPLGQHLYSLAADFPANCHRPARYPAFSLYKFIQLN